MLVFLDCEGEPTQELTALLVDESSKKIVDVFHRFVRYPFDIDFDSFSRDHVHGLDLKFLSIHGLKSEHDLIKEFHKWLSNHVGIDVFYAHSPFKEKQLLSLDIRDVCLKMWSERDFLQSHSVALAWKMNALPVNNVTCTDAHASFKRFRPKNVQKLSKGDIVKMKFSHHCSLYDCVECFLYLLFE